MKDQFRKEIELEGERPTDGHRSRFLNKLEGKDQVRKGEAPIKELNEHSSKPTLKWILGMASAAVITWAVFSVSFSSSEETEYASEKFNPVNAINKRSAQLESMYTQHVQPRIPEVLVHEPDLKKQVELLDKLDREYVKLKTLFIQTNGGEKVSKEMIRNHKLRLKIMEQMLNQLELMKSIKSKKNEIKSA